MKFRYIGDFPPPYGGVTIKNELLYNELSKFYSISKVIHYKLMPSIMFKAINVCRLFLHNSAFIIGVSAAKNTSLLVTKILYYFNRNSMCKSLYFMMGGTEAKRISGNLEQIKMYKCYKKIYVETDMMMKTLLDVGFENVDVYPNCRKQPTLFYNTNSKSKSIKCVFFSYITPEKGTDIIFDAAALCTEVNFYFYGHIDPVYYSQFYKSLAMNKNSHYCGVFKGKNEQVYELLSQYDLLLLPTRWVNEGVPGVLVESKIAGIPAIVSDIAYNKEIVQDNKEGIILKENNGINLAKAIKNIQNDGSFFSKLKEGAKKSAKRYYIESYILNISQSLKD